MVVVVVVVSGESSGAENPLSGIIRISESLLKNYYSRRFNQDVRLDNVFEATAENPVRRAGIGNDYLLVSVAPTVSAEGSGSGDTIAATTSATPSSSIAFGTEPVAFLAPPSTTLPATEAPTEDMPSEPDPIVYGLHGEEGNDALLAANANVKMYPGDGHNTVMMAALARVEVYYDNNYPDKSLRVEWLQMPSTDLRTRLWLPEQWNNEATISMTGQPATVNNHFGLAQALELGAGQWVNFNRLVLGGDVFFAAYLRTERLGSDIPVLDINTAAQDSHLLLEITATGGLRISISGSSARAPFILNTGNFFDRNRWVHTAIALSSDDTLRLYRDGVPVQNQSAPALPRSVWPESYIGRYANNERHRETDRQVRFSIDSLHVSDDIPEENLVAFLSFSRDGTLLHMRSDCAGNELLLPEIPDHMEFQDNVLIDGKAFIQSAIRSGFIESTEPVRNHLTVIDQYSASNIFDEYVDHGIIRDDRYGTADELTIDVYDNAQALLRRAGNDLVIYKADENPLQTEMALNEFPNRLLVENYFAADDSSIERIILNDRLLSADDVWHLTEQFPDETYWLGKGLFDEIVMLPDGNDLLLFFGNEQLDPLLSLNNLWPLRWYNFRELNHQDPIRMRFSEPGNEAVNQQQSLQQQSLSF